MPVVLHGSCSQSCTLENPFGRVLLVQKIKHQNQDVLLYVSHEHVSESIFSGDNSALKGHVFQKAVTSSTIVSMTGHLQFRLHGCKCYLVTMLPKPA